MTSPMHNTRAERNSSINGSKSPFSVISRIPRAQASILRNSTQNSATTILPTAESTPPPQQHIKRACPAMPRLCGRDGEDALSQAGFGQPARYRSLQHARPIRTEAAPGHDQQASATVPIAAFDKFRQAAMRLGLGQAVKIKLRLDGAASALESLGRRAVEIGKTGEPRARRCGGERRRDGWFLGRRHR